MSSLNSRDLREELIRNLWPDRRVSGLSDLGENGCWSSLLRLLFEGKHLGTEEWVTSFEVGTVLLLRRLMRDAEVVQLPRHVLGLIGL